MSDDDPPDERNDTPHEVAASVREDETDESDTDESVAVESDTGESDDVEWPVEFAGVTESIVTTLGPNGRWNVAALGLFDGEPVTATTWGATRTRQNFDREGEGYVQFTTDPVVFVDAALSVVEREEPVVPAADAWVRVHVSSVDRGTDAGTSWERWALQPIERDVRRERVGTIDRGLGAVVEASVVASRLGVPGYDEEQLRARLDWAASVVDSAGGPRDRAAFERLLDHAEIEDHEPPWNSASVVDDEPGDECK